MSYWEKLKTNKQIYTYIYIQNHSEYIYPYSIRMPENTDQKNFEYGYFSSSITALFKVINSINLIKQPARICTEHIVSTEQRQTKQFLHQCALMTLQCTAKKLQQQSYQCALNNALVKSTKTDCQKQNRIQLKSGFSEESLQITRKISWNRI